MLTISPAQPLLRSDVTQDQPPSTARNSGTRFAENPGRSGQDCIHGMRVDSVLDQWRE